MLTQTIIRSLGAAGFLLFSMRIMKRSLEDCGGSLINRTLDLCTKNDLSAVLFGTAVTALVQSSGAITLAAVGLADSGKLKLRRAIGVILGANVGTCITPWLMSLIGGGKDGIVSFFSAENLAALAAVAGAFICALSRRKAAGEALCAFGLILFSVGLLAKTLSPLSENEGFRRMATSFENPFLGLLAGAAATALLQSSAASVGILQAACAGGGISAAAALPVILGQNIGTTFTALFASAGASLNAKRTAFAHLAVNLIGAGVCLAGLFVLRLTPAAQQLSKPADAAWIAMFHTRFNVISTVVMFPFIGALEKLCLGIGEKRDVPKRNASEKKAV
ncbi:MAG: Na/Pi cotransporter family protein [Clostridia bacterium]|nr:Na/Pi cotransporter family protein [Clostridia bacterium]